MSSSHASLTDEHISSIIEDARQAWLTGDGEAFARLFTPSGQLIVPGQQWTGREAIRSAVEEYDAAYSVVAIAIQNTLIDGHRVAVEWTWQDRERETENLSRADDVIMITLEDGLIARWREYIDTQTPTDTGQVQNGM